MMECKNVEEFCANGGLDYVRKIIFAKFKNCLKYDVELDDVVNALVVHLTHSKAIEKYDSTRSKFSTYIWRVTQNFLFYSFLGKTKKSHDHYFNTVSLDAPIFEGADSKPLFYLPQYTDEEPSWGYDLAKIYEDLAEYDKNNNRAKLKFTDMFEGYLQGKRDTDFVKKENLTNAGVAASRLRLRKYLTKKYGMDFFRAA